MDSDFSFVPGNSGEESKVPSQEWGGEGEAGKTSPGRLSTFPRYQATHRHFPSNKSLSFPPPMPWESVQIEFIPRDTVSCSQAQS